MDDHHEASPHLLAVTQSVIPPPEAVFLNVYGAQESQFQGMNFASLRSLAGRYDNPIPTRCLAPIDCLKIPAQYSAQYSTP
jgi:hypothetical protein